MRVYEKAHAYIDEHGLKQVVVARNVSPKAFIEIKSAQQSPASLEAVFVLPRQILPDK